jgi:hypothetical protein
MPNDAKPKRALGRAVNTQEELDVESRSPKLVSPRKPLLPGGLAHFFSAGAKRVPTKAEPAKPIISKVPESPAQYEERMRKLRLQTELEILKERLAKAEADRLELQQLSMLAASDSADAATRFAVSTTEREDSIDVAESEEKHKSQHRSLAHSGYTGFQQEDDAEDDDARDAPPEEEDDEEKGSRSGSRGGSHGGSHGGGSGRNSHASTSRG